MTDTLRVDSAQLAAFQHDSRFDYDRELMGGSQNLLEWLAQVVGDWLEDTFNVVLDSDVTYYILIGLGVAVIVFLGWLYWRLRPKLFVRDERTEALDYDVSQDTIYGVDFDAEIRRAMEGRDYRQAVRLVYLQTLAALQDAGLIDWQLSKTPVQYMRQVDHEAFTRMSQAFIRVRYGNFEATESLFLQMQGWQAQLPKGGRP